MGVFKCDITAFEKERVNTIISKTQCWTKSEKGMKNKGSRWFRFLFENGHLDSYDLAALESTKKWVALRWLDGPIMGFKRDFGVCYVEVMYSHIKGRSDKCRLKSRLSPVKNL